MKKVMTIKEASDYTGLPYSRLRAMVLDGSIPSRKYGRLYYVTSKNLNDFFLLEDEPEPAAKTQPVRHGSLSDEELGSLIDLSLGREG